MGQASANRRISQRGSSMVEVAFILPIFFLLIFGIVQFSIVLFGYTNAIYASQRAIRFAVVHGSNSYYPASAATVTSIVTGYMWGAPSGSTVTVSWGPNNDAGSIIQVNVSLAFHTGIPYSSLSTVQIGTHTTGTIIF